MDDDGIKLFSYLDFIEYICKSNTMVILYVNIYNLLPPSLLCFFKYMMKNFPCQVKNDFLKILLGLNERERKKNLTRMHKRSGSLS